MLTSAEQQDISQNTGRQRGKVMVGKVLIIDGQATNRIMLKARLAAASYEALPASDSAAALSLARGMAPDAILVDLDTLGPVCGLSVMREIRSDRRLVQVPMIGLGAAANAERRIAALHAGADDVLPKPVEDAALLARLRNLIRQPESMAEGETGERWQGLAETGEAFVHPGLFAVVAPQPGVAARLRDEIAPLVPHRCITLSSSEALQDIEGHVPDLFVLEGAPEGPTGSLALMSDLRSRGPARHAAFCLVRPAQAMAMDALAFDLGVHDVIAAGGDPRETALRLGAAMRRKQAADHHRAHVQNQLRLAVRDPLTGLYNRRFALNQIVGMAEAAHMEGMTYAVMIIDLDRFKDVNDQWGHSAGDSVLSAVGDRLLANIRTGDLLARYGGEEFIVALPGAAAEEACLVAERLRHAVQDGLYPVTGGAAVRVTASIGVAIGTPGETVQGVIDRADHMLYTSKSRGRDRVTLDSPPGAGPVAMC